MNSSSKEYKICNLGEISKIQSGVGFPRSMQGKTCGKFPFAKVSDISQIVRGGGIEINSASNYVDEADFITLKTNGFPAGTIVFAKIGEAIRQNFRALTTVQMLFDNNVMGITPNLEVVNPMYLLYYLQTIDFYYLASTTTVPSIRKSTIEELKISLPSLEEQNQIVTRIRDCLERVGEISQLYKDNSEAIWSLKRSLVLGKQRSNQTWIELSELVDWIRDTEIVIETETYQFAGAKSFGRGLFHSATRTGQEFKYKEVRRLQHRDFTYPKLMAWEGAFGMVPKELDGFVVSPEFVVFRTNGDICPEVLDTYFRSPLCLDDVRNGSTGSNKRRRRLNPQAFLKLKVPVPPHEAQEQLKKVYEFEAKAAESWKDLPQTLEKIRQGILKKAFAGEL